MSDQSSENELPADDTNGEHKPHVGAGCWCGVTHAGGAQIHVGDEQMMSVLGTWVCADDCPHPDHFGSNKS